MVNLSRAIGLMGPIVIIIMGLSGCLDPTEEGPVMTVPEIREKQACEMGEGCTYWDEYQIKIDNSKSSIHMPIEQRQFKAISINGGVYNAKSYEGPQAIAAGHSLEVVLIFDMPAKGTLEAIEYYWDEGPYDLRAEISKNSV